MQKYSGFGFWKHIFEFQFFLSKMHFKFGVFGFLIKNVFFFNFELYLLFKSKIRVILEILKIDRMQVKIDMVHEEIVSYLN